MPFHTLPAPMDLPAHEVGGLVTEDLKGDGFVIEAVLADEL